jgi:hypothetical protein
MNLPLSVQKHGMTVKGGHIFGDKPDSKPLRGQGDSETPQHLIARPHERAVCGYIEAIRSRRPARRFSNKVFHPFHRLFVHIKQVHENESILALVCLVTHYKSVLVL